MKSRVPQGLNITFSDISPTNPNNQASKEANQMKKALK
jgi:hypothetical protein